MKKIIFVCSFGISLFSVCSFGATSEDATFVSQYKSECIDKSVNSSPFCTDSSNWIRYANSAQLRTTATERSIGKLESESPQMLSATELSDRQKNIAAIREALSTSATDAQLVQQKAFTISGATNLELLNSEIEALQAQINRQSRQISISKAKNIDTQTAENNLRTSQSRLSELQNKKNTLELTLPTPQNSPKEQTSAETFALDTAPHGAPLVVSNPEANPAQNSKPISYVPIAQTLRPPQETRAASPTSQTSITQPPKSTASKTTSEHEASDLAAFQREVDRKDVEFEFNKLKYKHLELQHRLNILQDKYDNALLGLYIKEKFNKLMKSNLLCETQSACNQKSTLESATEKVRTQLFQPTK